MTELTFSHKDIYWTVADDPTDDPENWVICSNGWVVFRYQLQPRGFLDLSDHWVHATADDIQGFEMAFRLACWLQAIDTTSGWLDEEVAYTREWVAYRTEYAKVVLLLWPQGRPNSTNWKQYSDNEKAVVAVLAARGVTHPKQSPLIRDLLSKHQLDFDDHELETAFYLHNSNIEDRECAPQLIAEYAPSGKLLDIPASRRHKFMTILSAISSAHRNNDGIDWEEGDYIEPTNVQPQ